MGANQLLPKRTVKCRRRTLPLISPSLRSAALKTAAAELQAGSGIAAVDAAVALPFARPFCHFNQTPNAPEIGRFFQELNYYRYVGIRGPKKVINSASRNLSK